MRVPLEKEMFNLFLMQYNLEVCAIRSVFQMERAPLMQIMAAPPLN